MKFGAPLLSTILSGALGGVVGATARGGIGYFRRRAIPGNPKTQDQTEARNALTGAAAYWRSTLTDAERSAWEALSTGGKSGEDLFVAFNSLRIRAGQAVVVTAPSSLAAVFTPPTIVVTAGDETLDVTGLSATDPWNATSGGAIHVFVERFSQRSSRFSRQFSFQYADSSIRAGTALTAVNLTVAEVPQLDGIVAGDILYVRLITTTADGRVSGEQITRNVIVAP